MIYHNIYILYTHIHIYITIYIYITHTYENIDFYIHSYTRRYYLPNLPRIDRFPTASDADRKTATDEASQGRFGLWIPGDFQRLPNMVHLWIMEIMDDDVSNIATENG